MFSGALWQAFMQLYFRRQVFRLWTFGVNSFLWSTNLTGNRLFLFLFLLFSFFVFFFFTMWLLLRRSCFFSSNSVGFPSSSSSTLRMILDPRKAWFGIDRSPSVVCWSQSWLLIFFCSLADHRSLVFFLLQICFSGTTKDDIVLTVWTSVDVPFILTCWFPSGSSWSRYCIKSLLVAVGQVPSFGQGKVLYWFWIFLCLRGFASSPQRHCSMPRSLWSEGDWTDCSWRI